MLLPDCLRVEKTDRTCRRAGTRLQLLCPLAPQVMNLLGHSSEQPAFVQASRDAAFAP